MVDSIHKSSRTRRNFIKLCMGAMTIGQLRQSFAAGNNLLRQYNRVQLVNFNKEPVLPDDLEVGQGYIFHYPFVATPCFLINLGDAVRENIQLNAANGETYTWKGGVGPNQSIVAFAAICAHKMTHPAKSVSFINYRHETINYQDKNHISKKGAQLIYCCSEKSVYDVKHGAKVLGGPANQPLTTILLEYDQTSNSLFAVGTSGGELYERFFRTFSSRLQLEYLIPNVDALVESNSEVVQNQQFSKTQMIC